MKHRLRDTNLAHDVLDFVNADPHEGWQLFQSTALREGAEIDCDEAKAHRIHERALGIMGALVRLSEQRRELLQKRHGLGAHELRADNPNIAPSIYWGILRGEAEVTTSVLNQIEKLAQDSGRGVILRRPKLWTFPLPGGRFVSAVTHLAVEILERRCEIRRCQGLVHTQPEEITEETGFERCGRFFLEDRNITNPGLLQKHCNKRCRQRSTYVANLKKNPNYYRDAKRKSRKRAAGQG